MMKKAFRILLVILITLSVLALLLIQRIDRTPFQETAHYRRWVEQLQTVTLDSTTGPLQISWAKENITPKKNTPLSGHGKRWGKHFDSIHDSIYVRSIAISNPQDTVYFVSADMLIVPPNIVQRVEQLLAPHHISLRNIHFGATHTHNGVGGWGEKLSGRLFSGKYDAEVVEELARQYSLAILQSSRDFLPVAQVRYGEYASPEHLYYRIPAEGGEVDDRVRSLVFISADSSTAELTSYAGHATILGSKFLGISRDYPGILVDSIERNERDFALFYAGAVGSTGVWVDDESGPSRAAKMGAHLYEQRKNAHIDVLSTSLTSTSIPIPLPDPTVRISSNLALRPWVFRWLFGEHSAHIKITKIGNTLLLGMPADFSGELAKELSSYAASRGLHLIITSFNGDYIGYITADSVYDVDFHETTIMSWNGYQAGGYFNEISKQIIDKMAF